jgi:hypothetical protein
VPLFLLIGLIPQQPFVTVDPGSNPDHDELGGEIGKVIVRRVYYE